MEILVSGENSQEKEEVPMFSVPCRPLGSRHAQIAQCGQAYKSHIGTMLHRSLILGLYYDRIQIKSY